MSVQEKQRELPQRIRQAWTYTWASTVMVILMLLFVVNIFLLIYLLGGRTPSSPLLLVVLIALSLVIGAVAVRVLFLGKFAYTQGIEHLKMVWVPIGLALIFAGLAFLDPFLGPVAVVPLSLAMGMAMVAANVWQRRVIWGVVAVIIGFYLWYSTQNASIISGSYFSFVVVAAVAPVTFAPTFWWWDVMLKLDEARAAESELATAKERLRIAGELHDIQGHHLQVIALKAELAVRLLAKDPKTAEEAMREVQNIARNTMEDTRALVRGMRQTEFGSELVNAVSVLEGAGIAARIDAPDTRVPAQFTEVLGLAVREATTNILRHSSAEHVVFSLKKGVAGVLSGALPDAPEGWILRISNDNPKPESVGSKAAGEQVGGNGLAVLRERVEGLSGSAEHKLTDSEFILTVTLPPSETPEQQQQQTPEPDRQKEQA